MVKIYFDAVKNLEVHDLSGQKNISQLKSDFKCPGLVDVTADREAVIEANKLLAEERATKETLIHAKMRENAIAELKAEGKLDGSGNVIKSDTI